MLVRSHVFSSELFRNMWRLGTEHVIEKKKENRFYTVFRSHDDICRKNAIFPDPGGENANYRTAPYDDRPRSRRKQSRKKSRGSPADGGTSVEFFILWSEN